MLDCVEQQLPGSSVWKIQAGKGAPEGAFEAGLCGTATAWFFSQEDFRQGVLQKVLLDVRLQPKVSSRGDQSVAMPCVEQQLPGSSVWKMQAGGGASYVHWLEEILVDSDALYP